MALSVNECSSGAGLTGSVGDVRVFESDELETSVPTDLTVSPASDDDKKKRRPNLLQKVLLERKQILRDLQLAKVELAQKELAIQNMNANFLARTDDLEEKLSDAIHQKQVGQIRLETQLKILDEESKGKQALLRKEIDSHLEKQLQLELVNKHFKDAGENLKQSLITFEYSDENYSILKKKNMNNLSLKDYVMLKVHEFSWALREDNEELKKNLDSTKKELDACKNEYLKKKEVFNIQIESFDALSKKNRQLSEELAKTKLQIEYGNYSQENFSRVKQERDMLEKQIIELKYEINKFKADLSLVMQEKESLNTEVQVLRQEASYKQQEKHQLLSQVGDLSQKLGEAQDKVLRLTLEVDHSRQNNNDMFNKMMGLRSQYKTDYETKLQEVKETVILAKTETYERELRLLKESKHSIVRQKNEVEAEARHIKNKYEAQKIELERLHFQENALLIELRKELHKISEELRKEQLLHVQTAQNLKEKEGENEKLISRFEIINEELQILKSDTHYKQLELETELVEKRAKLNLYEKLEEELDEVVNQAAQVTDELKAEQMVQVYTRYLSMPSSINTRLLQSVNLTRRILHQERENTALKLKLEELQKVNQKVTEQLSNANQLLDLSQQPYTYLLTMIREKELQLESHKMKVEELKEQMQIESAQNTALIKERDSLIMDLEKLFTQKEEIAKIKQLLSAVYMKQHNKTNQLILHQNAETSLKKEVQVISEFPEWYKKLKRLK